MQKLLLDFFPIVIFFIGFKLYGIYVATAALMVASLLQMSYCFIKYRKIEQMHLVTLILVLVFGMLTLFFHNDRFIQWKVTVINWLFSAVFLISPLFMKKSPVQYLMEKHIKMPDNAWKRLNFSWVIYFLFLGAINLYVAYFFSLDAWVNFKLFGLLGLTIVFVLAQGVYLKKYFE
jgi:intracellular septation protein